jgi:hypothetical protein
MKIFFIDLFNDENQDLIKRKKAKKKKAKKRPSARLFEYSQLED